MRKLHVEELEKRIAPAGLWSLWQSIVGTDAGQQYGHLVDADGNVDVGAATDAVNAENAGFEIMPVRGSFQLTDNYVIQESMATRILGYFGL